MYEQFQKSKPKNSFRKKKLFSEKAKTAIIREGKIKANKNSAQSVFYFNNIKRNLDLICRVN